MSMLNKFIVPELKIKSRSGRGSKNNLKPSKIMKTEITASTSKGAMTLSNFGLVKVQPTGPTPPNTGGGGKK